MRERERAKFGSQCGDQDQVWHAVAIHGSHSRPVCVLVCVSPCTVHTMAYVYACLYIICVVFCLFVCLFTLVGACRKLRATEKGSVKRILKSKYLCTTLSGREAMYRFEFYMQNVKDLVQHPQFAEGRRRMTRKLEQVC